MTTITDYTNLIPSANSQQPDFLATIQALGQGLVDNLNSIDAINALYDLDTAIGTQLDVVGQWVGFSRILEVPIPNVYFTLNVAGLGLDQGVLFGPFDPTEGIISLGDPTYRLMLYAQIAANIWDGTIQQAEKILQSIFVSSPGTLIFIQDNMDMSMDLILAGVIPSTLFQKLLSLLALRPAGVLSNAYSTGGGPAFGLDVENAYIAGLDVGSLVAPI